MSSNGEDNSRHACAACKHQRKKCENNCVFAPHFPPARANQFKDVHKIFGVKNMTGILEPLSLEERVIAVKSLEWEASAWKEDPVEGPFGLYRKLERRLDELLKNQQQFINNNNNGGEPALASISADQVLVGAANNISNINSATLGYVNNNNTNNNQNIALIHESMNYYDGGYWEDEIENPVHHVITNSGGINYHQDAPYFSAPPQGQGMMMRPAGVPVLVQNQRGGRLDAVVAQTSATNLLPKQEVQRAPQFLGLNNSALRPVNSYNNNNNNQGQYQSRRSRVPGRSNYSVCFDGNLGGSQGRGMC